MKITAIALAAAAFGALSIGMAATPAAAAKGDYLGGCAVTDLVTPNADACYGFYQGNVLSGSPADTAIQTFALGQLGLVWDGTTVDIIPELGGNAEIDFDTLLNGVTYIGVHWGPGEGPVGLPGGGTGFYRLDLDSDANLDIITAAFGSQSGARLYKTSECSGDCGGGGGGGVPEPAAWAFMIMGFGAAGSVLRRRRQTDFA